ncbi:MAG: hypothetical protein IIZ67_04860 [Bacilli bacterium]|nr:hypothetical protein [Bacilli bacterium]
MTKYYQLRKNEYFLSEYTFIDEFKENLELKGFEVDREYRQLFADIEEAHKVQRLIFIETGLNFDVEVFRKEEQYNED